MLKNLSYASDGLSHILFGLRSTIVFVIVLRLDE